MKKQLTVIGTALAGCLWAATCAAYNSGSTGADGAFNPTTSQSLQLPPDGVFNFTTVNIPAGVTITFIKNAGNTPVTILASGDVTVAGTINVSGSGSANVSGPGESGPGGYNGGRGGAPAGVTANWVNGYSGPNVGQAGIGPGGGAPGAVHIPSPYFGTVDVGGGGPAAYGVAPPTFTGGCSVTPGAVYGNTTLIPLVGGSGGGGGAGGAMLPGSGGGGGGGAILIAVSGTLNVTGSILANGGSPTSPGTTDGHGATGGAGSGGAIRLIASTVSGNGTISAVGGSTAGDNFGSSTYGSYGGCSGSNWQFAASTYLSGGAGRIRIEYETLLRNTPTNPAWLGGAPSLIAVPGYPTLAIDSVGGLPVPAQPSGSGDVSLPANFTNPVTVTFVTTGVTVGSSIKLTVMPVRGTAFSATSAPTTGTTASATSSVSVTLPPGQNVLQASVTYTVVASVGDAMSVYAQGERVEKVTLASALGSKETQVTLITVSGKEYAAPASVLALAASQG